MLCIITVFVFLLFVDPVFAYCLVFLLFVDPVFVYCLRPFLIGGSSICILSSSFSYRGHMLCIIIVFVLLFFVNPVFLYCLRLLLSWIQYLYTIFVLLLSWIQYFYTVFLSLLPQVQILFTLVLDLVSVTTKAVFVYFRSIVVDRFYMALFSARGRPHCACT